MIEADIPKEINQENKIFLNLTFRQLICVAVGAGAAFVVGVVFKLPIDVAVIPMGLIGLAAMVFGWVKKDGLPLEAILMKKIQAAFYHNNVRPYKTKNLYVTLLNREWDRRKAIDMGNKAIARQVRKEKKHSL